MEIQCSSASQLFQLQKQIRESRQNHCRLGERLSELQSGKDALLESSEDRRKPSGSLIDISETHKEIAALKQQQQTLMNRKEELDGDYRIVTDFIAKLKSQLSDLQAQEAQLQVQLDVMKTSIDQRRAANCEIKTKCAGLNQRLENCKNQVAVLEKKAAVERLRNEKLKKIHGETNQKRENLEIKQQSVLEKTQGLSHRIRLQREEITHLHKERKSTFRLFKDRQVEVNHLRVKLTNTRRRN